MAATEENLRVYQQLADLCEQRQEAGPRDVFLLLAADTALALGRLEDAERCRRRLVEASPHSLLKPYQSLSEALQSGDIQEYLADLRRQYPPEQAQQLLASHRKAATLAASSAATVRLVGDPNETAPPKPTRADSAKTSALPPLAVFSPCSSPAAPRPSNRAKENSAVQGPAQKELLQPRFIPEQPASGGLALLLFFLVLLLGVGWLAFVFLWPFLGG